MIHLAGQRARKALRKEHPVPRGSTALDDPNNAWGVNIARGASVPPRLRPSGKNKRDVSDPCKEAL